MVLALLKKAIQTNLATSKGFLIDGYPRELDQGKRFEQEVAPVERVLYFHVRVYISLNSMGPTPTPTRTLGLYL